MRQILRCDEEVTHRGLKVMFGGRQSIVSIEVIVALNARATVVLPNKFIDLSSLRIEMVNQPHELIIFFPQQLAIVMLNKVASVLVLRIIIS